MDESRPPASHSVCRPFRKRRHSAKGFYTPFKGLDQHFERKYGEEVFPREKPFPEKLHGGETEDEGELFFDVMKDVVPLLDNTKRRVPPCSPNRRAPGFLAREEQDVCSHLADLVAGDAPFELTYSDEYVDGAVKGLSPKIVKKLRNGEFSYQAYVDLHGLNRDQARHEVIHFVQESFARRRRCILIVSGRGLNSQDKEPILKVSLVNWLTHAPLKRLVLAFASARSYDGGAGAFYILLRASEASQTIHVPAP